MQLREELEKREITTLDPHASYAARTRGRLRYEEECDIRTCYMRDRDRIVHCKSFRRLKDKTQVFLAPQGDEEVPRAYFPGVGRDRRDGRKSRVIRKTEKRRFNRFARTDPHHDPP